MSCLAVRQILRGGQFNASEFTNSCRLAMHEALRSTFSATATAPFLSSLSCTSVFSKEGCTLDCVNVEEERIRKAYSKRTRDEVLYSWFSPGHLLMIQERERRLLTLLNRYGFASLKEKKILEVGCGTGQWLREFIKWGALPENVTGIDLLADRVSKARRLCPPGCPHTMRQCGPAAVR